MHTISISALCSMRGSFSFVESKYSSLPKRGIFLWGNWNACGHWKTALKRQSKSQIFCHWPLELAISHWFAKVSVSRTFLKIASMILTCEIHCTTCKRMTASCYCSQTWLCPFCSLSWWWIWEEGPSVSTLYFQITFCNIIDASRRHQQLKGRPL